LKVHISPVMGILGVASPLIGNPHTAGEPDLAVDDKYFSVRAIVELSQAIPVKRVIALDFDSGTAHFCQQSRSHLFAAYQSSTRCTLTPADARSISALANSSPVLPDQ
jgi:hypothetical protein